MKTSRNRLRHLAKVIGCAPVHSKTKAAAFDRFKASGELPDNQRVAEAVVTRARRGYDVVETGDRDHDTMMAFRARLGAPMRREDPILCQVYSEAVSESGTLGGLARELLVSLATHGIDVTEPVFVEGFELPKWGTASFQLMGLPRVLAQPPYEEQAARLFARYEDIRRRVPQRDRWFAELGACIGEFRQTGELPEDELLREAVLADAELTGLMKHALGEDVAELMAAFDAIAKAVGAERDATVGRLQALAAAGHLAPRE